MSELYLVNKNTEPRTIQLYDASVVTINPDEYSVVECKSLIEQSYYNTLMNQNFIVSYNPNVVKSVKPAEDPISDTTSEDPYANVVEDKLGDLTNPTIDPNIADIAEELSASEIEVTERTLDQLEPWEYKKILQKLGVSTRASSASTLKSLVESTLATNDDANWKELLTDEDDANE